MRIVQTFWTAGRNPLEYSFGWSHPEYNLMSWALSCLSLREHYDEVALYTDTRGKEVLIDLLHLPYTEVHVVFDDFPCLPQHWALSKIKTYSLQDKPFLHVDGDVYLPKPIDPAILDAPLVAQNREIGTGYYRQMMDQVLEYKGFSFPAYMAEGICQESVASYNMGVFGGSDLEFIQHYCLEAQQFIESNNINNPKHANSRVNCNILFEQVLLALLSDKENRPVSCLFDKKIKDNGYMVAEFCNLNKYETYPYFHVLGGHKRSQGVFNSLERTMLKMHDDVFWTIINLFPGKNWRLSEEIRPVSQPVSVERCIAQYEDILEELGQSWREIPADKLHAFERRVVCQPKLVEMKEEELGNVCLKRNDYLHLFSFSRGWPPKAIELLHRKLNAKQKLRSFGIAITPSLTGCGMRETPVANLGQNVLDVLKNEVLHVLSLVDILADCFSMNLNMNKEAKRKMILVELDYLAFYGIIEIKNYNYHLKSIV